MLRMPRIGIKLRQLCSLLNVPDMTEGMNDTRIAGFRTYKSSCDNALMPDMPGAFVYILHGRARLHDGPEIADLGEGEYFVLPACQPARAANCPASANLPLVALTASFCIEDVVDVLLDLDMRRDFPPHRAASGTEYSENFIALFLRIFALPGPGFMLTHLKRELIFDLLTGPTGDKFIAGAHKMRLSPDMFRINSWIRLNYRRGFSVEDLAAMANMNISNFHRKFKTAVGMGPIQCQKKLRLAEARKLMLYAGANVTGAALDVGYESLSQFIGDYRRMFGQSPQKDIREIRRQLDGIES